MAFVNALSGHTHSVVPLYERLCLPLHHNGKVEPLWPVCQGEARLDQTREALFFCFDGFTQVVVKAVCLLVSVGGAPAGVLPFTAMFALQLIFISKEEHNELCALDYSGSQGHFSSSRELKRRRSRLSAEVVLSEADR